MEAALKTALQVRKRQKMRKPTFLRQAANRIKRIPKKWRHPRGKHSKMRMKLRSYRKQPSIGYSSPRAARFLTPEGYPQHVVASPSQLTKDMQAIIISGSVGAKKKIVIIQKAQQLGLKVLNLKDPQAFIQKTQEKIKARKDLREKAAKKKEESKKEAEKKAKEATKEQEAKTAEEKLAEQAKLEKEEMKKVLEQK